MARFEAISGRMRRVASALGLPAPIALVSVAELSPSSRKSMNLCARSGRRPVLCSTRLSSPNTAPSFGIENPIVKLRPARFASCCAVNMSFE